MDPPAPSRLLRWPVLLGLGLLLGAILQGYAFYPLMVSGPLEIYGRDAQGLDLREFLYRQFWRGELPRPLAYRPLSYWMEALLMRATGFNLGVADVLLNTGWTAVAFAATVRFAARFLHPGYALFAGCWLVLACLLGFQGHTHQPSDYPQLALAALLYLQSTQPALAGWLLLALIGSLNRESFLLLWGYPLLLHAQSGTLKLYAKPLLAGFLLCILTAGLVVFFTGYRPAYAPLWMLPQNITPEAIFDAGPEIILGFAIPLGFALRGWVRLPDPLRSGVGFSLLYFMLMLLVGRITEFRLMLPVLPLLCTAAVTALAAESSAEALTRHSVEA